MKFSFIGSFSKDFCNKITYVDFYVQLYRETPRTEK